MEEYITHLEAIYQNSKNTGELPVISDISVPNGIVLDNDQQIAHGHLTDAINNDIGLLNFLPFLDELILELQSN